MAAPAALTIALAPISYGPIQYRVSEALTIMPFFIPCSIWGLWGGCILSNLYTGSVLDILVGGLATLRRNPPLPEQIAKDYATKKELEKEIEEINKRIEYLEHSLLNEVRNASSAIGRIEGALGIHK